MEDIRDRDIQDNTEKLFDAINDYNLDEVEEILSNKVVDINGVYKGITPLICAVNRGNLHIVRRLLKVPEIKLDIASKTFDIDDGYTPLHYACKFNKASIVKLLCQDSRCSPDVVNKKDNVGATPLIRAVRCQNLDIIRTLLKHPGIELGNKHTSMGSTALHYACAYKNVSMMKLFCQDSRCSPSIVNMKDSYGETALVLAVYYGFLDIVKELDKEGTDFFAKDRKGRTLIEMARMFNKAEVLEYLIERSRVDSLKVIAAHNIARYMRNKADVETLVIPVTVRQYLAGYVDADE